MQPRHHCYGHEQHHRRPGKPRWPPTVGPVRARAGVAHCRPVGRVVFGEAFARWGRLRTEPIYSVIADVTHGRNRRPSSLLGGRPSIHRCGCRCRYLRPPWPSSLAAVPVPLVPAKPLHQCRMTTGPAGSRSVPWPLPVIPRDMTCVMCTPRLWHPLAVGWSKWDRGRQWW